MHKIFPNFIKKISWPQIVMFALCVLVLGMNIRQLSEKVTTTHHKRQEYPPIFLGIKFAGLEDILGDTEYIGYYTDNSLDDKVPAMQFAQAQYTLAPVVLDFGNMNRAFVLLDCSSEKVAFDTVKKNRLVPLRRNQFGVVLAKNPFAME